MIFQIYHIFIYRKQLKILLSTLGIDNNKKYKSFIGSKREWIPSETNRGLAYLKYGRIYKTTKGFIKNELITQRVKCNDTFNLY